MATPSTILIAVLTFLSLAAHGAQQWLGNTGLTNDTPRIAYDKINTNFANLWAEVYTNLPAQIGSGGGGGGATNAVTKVNDLTNALQYFQIRTNAASAPTVNTNGFASKGTNFFDFPYAGNAVHGIMNSNDWQKIPFLSLGTNLSISGELSAYRATVTNYLHVKGRQTNDTDVYFNNNLTVANQVFVGDNLDVSASGIFHNDIQVTLDSSFAAALAVGTDLSVARNGSIGGKLNVTSNILAGALTVTNGITNLALTASRFMLTDANKQVVSSANAVTDTEFGYLSGVSSSIQNQLAAKQTGSAILSNAVTAGSIQTGSATLSNAVPGGVILTNIYTTSTSGIAITNGIQNGRGNFKNFTQSGSITITDQGTNIVIGSAAGGGNVVGPPSSTAFTLAPYADASGALLTNSSVATDSARTNLFTPGYDNAYRLRATNGIDDLGWLHVASPQTNDSKIWGQDLNLAQSLTVVGTAFLTDLVTHNGAVAYVNTTISALDVDWSGSSARRKTLSGNSTVTFSNVADDRHVWIELTQDATGTRTVTWPTATWLQHTNQSGTLTAGGINTNANFVTVFHFWRTAGTVYGEVASTAPSRFAVEWESGSVPSSDVAVRVSDETGTDKLVFSSNSELSGTTRAATLAVTNLGTFGSINVTTQANVGALTITNLGTAGSFNVTTQLNAGALTVTNATLLKSTLQVDKVVTAASNVNAYNVTVTNTLQGLGTGDNYISKLLATNDLRVQVGGNTTASNAWVGGTFYIDNSAYKNAGGDAVLTNASSVVVKALMLTNLYDAIEIWTSGAAQSSTATTNEIKVIYGSETILDTGLQGSSNTTWRVQTMITRTADKSQVCQASLWWGGNTFQLTNINVGLSQTNGIDTTFRVQLASRKAGSFTNDFLHAKYLPAPH